MASDFSRLGVGHSYAPGHEPEMLDGLAAAMSGGAPLVFLAITAVVIFFAVGGPFGRRAAPRTGRGPGTLVSAGKIPQADAGALLKQRTR